MLKRIVILAVIALLMASACTPAPTQAPAVPATQAPAAEPTKAPAAEPTKAPEQAPAAAAGGIKELKIIWAEWDPANYLAELVKDYEKETGIKVTIIQEPWGS